MPRAVVFDLFETLVTELVPDFVAGPGTGEQLGLEEETFRAGWARMRERRMCGRIDFRRALVEICESAAHTPDPAVIDRLVAERLADKTRPFERLDARIIELVSKLRSAGLRLGVISNASGDEVAAWPASALAASFESAVFSFEVGLLKPDPEIYAIACRELDVAPHEALFVGDGGAGELAGAERAGLRAYWATWFLDRWPITRHTSVAESRRHPRLREPAEVLAAASAGG